MDSYDIIQAAKGSALNTFPLEDAKEMVRVQIDRAYTLAELPRPEALVYEQTVDEVLGKIMRSYGYMTSQELALVCECGVSGELTRYTKPSAAVIFGWIAAYMGSETRKEAIRNYRRNNLGLSGGSISQMEVEKFIDIAKRRALEPEETLYLKQCGALTPEVIAELNKYAEERAIRDLWGDFRSLGKIGDDRLDGFCAMALDGALRRGLFAVRPEHWQMARDMARRDRRRSGGFAGIVDNRQEYRAKRVLLEMCFRGQKESGRDLIINN